MEKVESKLHNQPDPKLYKRMGMGPIKRDMNVFKGDFFTHGWLTCAAHCFFFGKFGLEIQIGNQQVLGKIGLKNGNQQVFTRGKKDLVWSSDFLSILFKIGKPWNLLFPNFTCWLPVSLAFLLLITILLPFHLLVPISLEKWASYTMIKMCH